MIEALRSLRSSRFAHAASDRWRCYLDVFQRQKNVWQVFIFLAFVYAYFYQDPEWNGNSRLALTAAIVQQGRLTIDSFHDQEKTGLETGDKSFYQGHYYSDKAIGSSVLAALPYAPIYWGARLLGLPFGSWLMKHLLTLLVIGLPSALASAIIYLVCERISASPLRAVVVTAAVTLGSLAFPFSLVFFSHQLAAALLWISFFLIFRLRDQSAPPGPGYRLLLGFLLGFSLITEYPTALIILPLVGYYLYMMWLKKAKSVLGVILYPALGGLLPISLMLGYNLFIFGQPLVSSYQYLVNPVYAAAMSRGIMGIGLPNITALFFLTFQPAMGLFWQSPVLLMVFPCAFYILKNQAYRLEGGLALFICAVYLVVMSGYFEWWGGGVFAPRHLIPMLPFLCLPLIFVPRRLFPWLAGLTVISIAQMMIPAAGSVLMTYTPMSKYAKMSFFDYSTLYCHCLPQLLDGNFAWNLGNDLLGLSGWASLAPVILVIAGACFGISHAFHPSDPVRASRR